jgi:hypothetical protein
MHVVSALLVLNLHNEYMHGAVYHWNSSEEQSKNKVSLFLCRILELFLLIVSHIGKR